MDTYRGKEVHDETLPSDSPLAEWTGKPAPLATVRGDRVADGGVDLEDPI